MKKIITGDGSHTLFNADINEHYHSIHGAYTESKHVFVGAGLEDYRKKYDVQHVHILEVGFGTGLNLYTTLEFLEEHGGSVTYHSLEAYPLSLDVFREVGHDAYVNKDVFSEVVEGYEEALQEEKKIQTSKFRVFPCKLLEYRTDMDYDVVYFDAFSEIHQPEMWSEESLAHLAQYMKTGAFLVTYAITGNLKRRLKGLGFKIEKLPGAPGKREMLRAVKV